MEGLIYKKSTLLTVHSEGNKEYLVKKGAPKENVIVLPNWVDTDFIQPGERINQFRSQYKLGDSLIVSFAGTMGYSQDLDIILDTAKLFGDDKNVIFILVGDGAQKDRLEKKAEKQNLENVMFIPMQEREKYPFVLQASDISLVTLKSDVKTPVVPSKILSIMASGRALVAALPLDGDAPRLINDAECGIVVEAENAQKFANALRELSINSKMRNEMGQNGRKYAVKNLSKTACVSIYSDLFNRIDKRVSTR